MYKSGVFMTCKKNIEVKTLLFNEESLYYVC